MKSEREVQDVVRMEASRCGFRIWRNNLGAVTTQSGSFIRFGLANDSSAMNAKLKSSDLIGIKPVTITQEMVGSVVGVFLSREIKREGWKYKATPEETAQLAWINLINSMGGDACFATGEGTFGRQDEATERGGTAINH
jgi:hypothetical protein